MLASLALLAVMEMAPCQTGDLKITNIRPTYGLHGPTRSGNQVLAGDVFLLDWLIQGLKAGEDGKVLYTMAVEIKNKTGKVVFAQKPQKREFYLSLGGDQVHAFFSTSVGTDTEAGDYTIKVTVEDLIGKTSTSFTRTFEVTKPSFGIVRIHLTYDEQGQVPAPPAGVVGQTIQVNFFAIGYSKDKDSNPHLKVTMRVLADGKEVVKPATGEVKTALNKNQKLYPFSFVLSLNRPGTFTVELKVEDMIGKKTETEKFTMVVRDVK